MGAEGTLKSFDYHFGHVALALRARFGLSGMAAAPLSLELPDAFSRSVDDAGCFVDDARFRFEVPRVEVFEVGLGAASRVANVDVFFDLIFVFPTVGVAPLEDDGSASAALVLDRVTLPAALALDRVTLSELVGAFDPAAFVEGVFVDPLDRFALGSAGRGEFDLLLVLSEVGG